MKYPPVNNTTEGDSQTNGETSPITRLTFDPEKYRAHLEEFEFTEAQQNELLETLWYILRTFVDIGFGLDAVQLFASERSEKASVCAGNFVKGDEYQQTFHQMSQPKDVVSKGLMSGTAMEEEKEEETNGESA